jgi:hypothetical protein
MRPAFRGVVTRRNQLFEANAEKILAITLSLRFILGMLIRRFIVGSKLSLVTPEHAILVGCQPTSWLNMARMGDTPFRCILPPVPPLAGNRNVLVSVPSPVRP